MNGLNNAMMNDIDNDKTVIDQVPAKNAMIPKKQRSIRIFAVS